MSPASSEIGVALLGLGNVGAGVVKLLEDNATAIDQRLGARLAVRAIAVRDPGRKKKRLVEVDPALLTRDVDAAIDRDDVAIVVELIGGVTEAKAAILRAIERGKHVITANKAVLAEHGREIFAAAAAKGVDVYYEAAVCGGVPVIRALREGLASDRVEELIGIVNGTSNFILTAMADDGRAFGDVLGEAQQKGYAEADPTLDVGGGDAAHKLAILVMLCFHTHVAVEAISKDGIDRIDPIDLAYAKRFGYVVKPVVYAREHVHGAESRIEARVHPALVPASWLLASVAGAKNALYVTSYALGPSMYYGAGAGMLPTAMAVVSDMIEVSRNLMARGARPGGTRPLGDKAMLPMSEIRTRYYLRFGVADRPGVLGQLTTILGHHGVSIAQVVQDGARGETARVIVLTHDAREGDVQAALGEIAKLQASIEPGRLIRIAGEPAGAGR